MLFRNVFFEFVVSKCFRTLFLFRDVFVFLSRGEVPIVLSPTSGVGPGPRWGRRCALDSRGGNDNNKRRKGYDVRTVGSGILGSVRASRLH